MILVTGANGLLGSHITTTLVREGYAVKGYIREQSDLSLIPLDVREKVLWTKGTLFNSHQLGNALEGVDKIIHAAALISFSPSKTKEMYRTNVQGTACLVNEALASGVKQFVHISSIAALGRPVGKSVIDETDLWIESAHNTHYAKSKYLSELEIFRAFEEGLEGFVVNPSVILGPGDLTKSSAKLFGYVLKGGKYYTKGSLNYVDVRDVSAIVRQLMNTKVSGERFVLNGGTIKYQHFFELAANALEVNPPSKLPGTFAKEILWRVEYLRSLLSGSEPLITKETARLSETEHRFNSDKIKTTLGYDFYKIEDTVKWVCETLTAKSGVYNLS